MATRPAETTNDFDAAFASFAQGEPAPVEDTTPVEDTAPVEESEPVEGAETVEPAPAAEKAPPAEEAAGEETAPAAEEPVNTADALIERLSQVLQERPAEQPKPEPAPQPEAVEIYTPEEQEFLSRYEEDWTDVSRGEQLKRRSEYRELVGFVFSQVAQQVQPLLEMVDILATRSQLSDLRSRVEDYDGIRDQVVEWVGKQPAYLQAAYNNVIQAGTPDEVVDLIERFRKDTGAAAPARAPEPKKSELSDDTRKAVAALAPVSTKRSAVPQAEDAGDFDSAFARFAEVLKR